MCRIKALLSSTLSFFTSLSLWWCCCEDLLSGHRTESHVPHRSLLIALCLVSFSHKCSLLFSAPLLCYYFTLLPPILPSLMFAFYPPPLLSVSLPLGEPHIVSSPEPICSSPAQLFFFFFPPLVGVFLYLALLSSCGFMPFTWEPLFFAISTLRCAYLVVCAVVLWVEVEGQEREHEDKSEQTDSYPLRCSFQLSLPCSLFLSPAFSPHLSVMTSSPRCHASRCILVSKKKEKRGRGWRSAGV